MSLYTKVFVVLLSLFCIFLSGSVVTYVGSANNVMKENEQLSADLDASIGKHNTDIQIANEKLKAADLENTKLQAKIAELENDKNEIMIDLKNEERSAIKWQDRVNSWAGVVKANQQTISDMEKSLILTRDKLADEQAKTIKMSTQLNEVTTALDEHIVMLEALKAEKRRLLEQKSALEQQIRAITDKDVQVQPVTQIKSTARPAEPISAAAASVTGLVSEVSSNLVALSIGTADGVKEGMKFHVTRGSSFICDLQITDVDIDKSAGIIELRNGTPKIGDTASTEL